MSLWFTFWGRLLSATEHRVSLGGNSDSDTDRRMRGNVGTFRENTDVLLDTHDIGPHNGVYCYLFFFIVIVFQEAYLGLGLPVRRCLTPEEPVCVSQLF